MMNNNDIRPGRNRFPYGDRHDMGISLERVVGSAEIPGTTVDETYVAITLHKSYYEHAMASAGQGERTIYIKESLLGPSTQSEGEHLVTIRLGQSFHSEGQSAISGRVAGVVGVRGLVGIFSWRVAFHSLEMFPDSALTVFDSVLTAADVDGTTWGGASAYAAATTGAPLYYFFWDAAACKLASPVRRVLAVDDGPSPYVQSSAYYGIFVPVDGNGSPQSPIPAYMLTWDAVSPGCVGGVSVLEAEVTSQLDDTAEIGSAEIAESAEWGPPGGAATDVYGLDGGYATHFDYGTEFPTASAANHTAGYLFAGWYNSALAIDDPAQNTNRIFIDGTALSLVHLLEDYLGFSGTAENPEKAHLVLTPKLGETPSVAAELEFSISDVAATEAGESSALLAVSYSAETTICHCYGTFYASMWVTMYNIKTIKYNTLSNGSDNGQLLYWDQTTSRWTPGLAGGAQGQLIYWDDAVKKWTAGIVGSATGQLLSWNGSNWVAGAHGVLNTHLLCWNSGSKKWEAGLVGSIAGQILKWSGAATGWTVSAGIDDGTAAGQLLSWNNTSKKWIAGLTGTTAGQVLKWNGTGWTAGVGSMPSGADKDTMFYDGTTGWTANVKIKWTKLETGNPSGGGVLLLDLAGCPARAWDSAMPGFAIAHPSGGTCGVFANIESGANGGARLDMGWGGANGGNFELYANSHPTRPGEFRVIYGPNGHIEFKKYVSGTDWRVTSGLSKEGRLFCGFNDAQFPGVTGNVGTNVAPAFPFQVFNETSQDSKVVAGVSKEGRGFFGCLGNPATGLPAFPLEIYNEAGAAASSRVAGISKNGRAFFGVSGAAAPTPEHPLEVYNEAGSTAAARKMYVTKDGKIVTSATVSSIAHTAQLDCNDIAMTTGATAQTVKLREMVIPYKSGSVVKGKLAQVMCGAGYGEELDLGGMKVQNSIELTAGGTAQLVGDTATPGNLYAYCTNSNGTRGWMQGVQIDL